MAKFIYSTTTEGQDLVINTDTIKYVERNPNDKRNSIWVWTDWANNGYVELKENIKDFALKIKLLVD